MFRMLRATLSTWRAFLLPLLALTSASGELILNEIHYAPDVKTEAAEFVEIYNSGTEPVSLSGWRLAGGLDYLFPNGTAIGANGYLVVAQNPAVIGLKFGVAAIGPWQGRLSNQGDRVRLVDPAGTEVDEVEYQLGFPWPTVGEPPGLSIELIHPGLDNSLGGNWRASVVGGSPGGTQVLLPRGAEWRYLKGTDEASDPIWAWHETAFDHSGWEAGNMPIGYGNDLQMRTFLGDMRRNYSTVYFRRTFQVQDPTTVSRLLLRAAYDDGFKIWINGHAVNDGSFNFATGDQFHDAVSGPARESNAYEEFTLNSPQAFLVSGENVIAVHAANASRDNSSDFFIDLELIATMGGASQGPTPGARNAVYGTNAPPQIRQVSHSPKQPAAGQPVLVVAKITDPEGVGQVSLLYQLVDPGNYIELQDAAYENNWTELPMNDSGQDGDAYAGDSIYTATVPGALQQHRRLVRYRITAEDARGLPVRVPYLDDPEPNFAYFCYDGIPGWRGAVRPGITPVVEFSSAVMSDLPAVHLISKVSEVEEATWFSKYGGDAYLWTGTLVYNGKVYDHIHYRARGGVWRYAMVKNMWKFDLNRGHDFEACDDYGRKYRTGWTKLNLGASIQQGDYDHRGEQGMFESVGFRMFNLAGVESPSTAYVQFRVIDDALEADPADQYEGDFWGVYLAIEQEDGRFLDEHDLPDGNLYKMEGGTGELNNIGPSGPMDKSDLNSFLGTYRNSGSPPSEAWWRTNFDLDRYYSYQAIVQGIHHYDICYGKNYFYYRNPETGRWSVHTWDLDLTWANNMYDSGCGGVDDLYRPVLGGGGYPARPTFVLEYRNRVRELLDLFFNTDQAWKLIDEHARLLRGTQTPLTLLDADRVMWDYNPKMIDGAYSSSLNKAGHGRFYQWPREAWVTKNFSGAVQLMKDYVMARSTNLNAIAADPTIPTTPTATYTGASNYPLNQLRFRSSAYSGANAFAAVKWRLGEVSDPGAPAYDPNGPRAYEITPVWETPELTTPDTEITVPAGVTKVGHAYRARARMKDVTGRWSHWSAPVQFTVGLPDNAGMLVSNLRLTELMYDPAADSDFEFIELHNASATETLDLGGATFTSGIDYTFAHGTMISPGGYLILTRGPDATAFRSHYGLSGSVPVLGPYSGGLANEGEELTLKTGAAGLTIFSFDFAAGRGWPAAANGAGHSLVPLDGVTEGQATGSLDYPGNWRASAFLRGSPGRAEPPSPASQLLLNELAAHTDYSDPQRPEYDSNDWIELLNSGTGPVQLEDHFLSDDPANLRKYALAAGTLQPGSRLVLDEITHFHNPVTSGFGIDKSGEQIFLSYLPGTVEDRVVDAVAFKGQENGMTLSRYTDGNTWWFQAPATRGQPNAAPVTHLVISELMYHPPDLNLVDNTTNEYLEIFNPMGSAVALGDTNGQWRLDGGIEFTFPAATAVPAGGTLLVVSFDPADNAALNAFKSVYGITNAALQFVGPYSGKLGNRSDRIGLEKPQAPDAVGDPYSWVIVDEVIYGNQEPWPAAANGSGSSLHRSNLPASGNDPTAWTAAVPNPGQAGEDSLDADKDGMPDAWERQYGLDPGNPSDANADADTDGMTNLGEFLAGTDPKRASSVLRFESVIAAEGTVTLEFHALAQRSYSVLYRATAEAGPWERLSDIAPEALDRLVAVEDSGGNALGARFYRLVTPAIGQ